MPRTLNMWNKTRELMFPRTLTSLSLAQIVIVLIIITSDLKIDKHCDSLVITYLRRKGLAHKGNHVFVVPTLEEDSAALTTVQKTTAKFRIRGVSLAPDPRTGRPENVTTE